MLLSDAEEPGRQRSDRSASSEQTTRVTAVVYVDGDGNEQSFEVPGWIGITADLAAYSGDIAAHLAYAGADASCLTTLKQIFIERPYRDFSTAPNEITVVVLRKADESRMGMLQEFAGRIDDHSMLAALVGWRIGPDIAGWRFTEVRRFKRGGNDEGSIPSQAPQTRSEMSTGQAS